MRMIEELFYGNICPCEKSLTRGSEYSQLLNFAVKNEEKLSALLSPQQKEMFEKVKEAFRNMILKRKEALSIAQSVLSEGPWDAPQILNGYGNDSWEKSGSVEWYRQRIQGFVDLMNQKLKDLNKEIETIEKGDSDEDEE